MKHTTPRVQLNGDTKERLLEEAQACWQGLEEARKAFAFATPHGRNWQGDSPEIYAGARLLWDEQVSKIRDLQTFITEHCDEIYEQGVDR